MAIGGPRRARRVPGGGNGHYLGGDRCRPGLSPTSPWSKSLMAVWYLATLLVAMRAHRSARRSGVDGRGNRCVCDRYGLQGVDGDGAGRHPALRPRLPVHPILRCRQGAMASLRRSRRDVGRRGRTRAPGTTFRVCRVLHRGLRVDLSFEPRLWSFPNTSGSPSGPTTCCSPTARHGVAWRRLARSALSFLCWPSPPSGRGFAGPRSAFLRCGCS